MSPKLITEEHCPHCGVKLPEPKPRVCPECMGSLQKRYLTSGCLTSAPKIVLFVLFVRLLLSWTAN